MKKSIYSIMFTALLSVCVVHSAMADFTAASTVKVVWSYANSDGYVFLDNVDCSVGNYKYFVLGRSAAKHEQLMSMLLAAFLSGKKARLGFAATDNFCRVSSVQLLH